MEVSLNELTNNQSETKAKINSQIKLRPIDCFNYFIIIFQDILIILLLFYFFWFNRGYSVNDQLDFVLTVIKRDYNTNDRLKFILSFIRRENGLNKWLKHVKNGRKEN